MLELPPPADQEDMPVPTFGPRMVCTRCGIIGATATERQFAAMQHSASEMGEPLKRQCKRGANS
jgi:hypothetical protein